MNNIYSKEKQLKKLGTTAKILSLLVIIPSIMLLFIMLTGINKQTQYGYSMYAMVLAVLGFIPSLLSIIFGIITYSKYHKNKQLYHNSKNIALSALLLSISSAIMIILDLLLDTFVFP